MNVGVVTNYPMGYEARRTQRATTEKTFAQKLSANEVNDVEQTKEMTPEEELEAFKKEFYQELSQITMHSTVSNAAVNVTEAAFKRMKDDPEYKQQVLNWIKHDLGVSYGSRNASVMLTVGSTLEECRGDAWPVSADSEFGICSQNSFYKRNIERKERQDGLLEEYLEKRAQAKRLQEKLMNEEVAEKKLEYSRMMKSWHSESHVSQASAAYEANVLVESTGSDIFESAAMGDIV